MTVNGKKTLVAQPVTLESHYHTEFDGIVIAFMAVFLLLFALCLVMVALGAVGWGDDAGLRHCIALHPHAVTQCLTKVYGH